MFLKNVLLTSFAALSMISVSDVSAAVKVPVTMGNSAGLTFNLDAFAEMSLGFWSAVRYIVSDEVCGKIKCNEEIEYLDFFYGNKASEAGTRKETAIDILKAALSCMNDNVPGRDIVQQKIEAIKSNTKETIKDAIGNPSAFAALICSIRQSIDLSLFLQYSSEKFIGSMSELLDGGNPEYNRIFNEGIDLATKKLKGIEDRNVFLAQNNKDLTATIETKEGIIKNKDSEISTLNANIKNFQKLAQDTSHDLENLKSAVENAGLNISKNGQKWSVTQQNDQQQNPNNQQQNPNNQQQNPNNQRRTGDNQQQQRPRPRRALNILGLEIQ